MRKQCVSVLRAALQRSGFLKCAAMSTRCRSRAAAALEAAGAAASMAADEQRRAVSDSSSTSGGGATKADPKSSLLAVEFLVRAHVAACIPPRTTPSIIQSQLLLSVPQITPSTNEVPFVPCR